MAEKLERGFLAAFEGIDGSGKATQAWLTAEWLKSRFGEAVLLSEPDDNNALGQIIRQMLKREIPMPHPLEFQRHYVIQRAVHVLTIIAPALSRRAPVVMDRYALSTIAYGMLGGYTPATFIEMHEEVLSGLMLWPDVSLVLDISPASAAQRLKLRGAAKHSYGAGQEFFDRVPVLARVRKNYRHMARYEKSIGRVLVVNGEQSVTEVFEGVKKAIEPLLPIER